MKLINNKRGLFKNKGFAVSGILYPILILTLFLVVQILTMMASRKSILDKNRQQLLDSVDASNKVYNNEELSSLLVEQQELNKTQASKIEDLEKKIIDNKNATDGEISKVGTMFGYPYQKNFVVYKDITSANATTSKVVVNTGQTGGAYSISVRLVGSFNYINYGGYARYDAGSLMSSGNCYGFGENLEKKGELGNRLDGISTSCSSDSSGKQVISMTLKFNSSHINGSTIYAFVTVYNGNEKVDTTTVSFS